MADELRKGADEVAAKLRAAGFEVYFAGGCVRDLLRGVAPKDYDLVTDALPEEVTRLFKRTIEVGAAFGVVRVLTGKGREYEVATYRRDLSYSDGRHPDEVVYSKSKAEDVRRRDFTINALLMDPVTEEVIDLVGGRADLERGIIRAVGDAEARFSEDRLRMLRAVRFAARFGFEIEAATLVAIEKHAEALRAVSVERIVMELRGVFSSKDPALGYRLLVRTHLWPAIFSVPAGPVLEARFERFIGAAGALDPEGRSVVALALIFDLAPLDRDGLETELRRLKLSRSDLRAILRLVAAVRVLEAPDAKPADKIRIAVDPERALFRAYLEARLGEEAPLVKEMAGIEESLAKRPLPVLPLLTGEDLKELGVPAGPRYKDLLRMVEDAALERRIATKEEAIALVKANIGAG